MFPRRFALIIGIFMLAVGAISLMPNMVGSAEGLPLLKNENSYGLFLGLFAMNIFNKIALIVLGLGGIMAASARFTSLPASIHFSRLLFFATGALAILGLFPQTNTLNGHWPLFGNLIWLHAAHAVLGAYFGYALTAKVPDQNVNRDFKTPAHGLR
jgi:hypothetical protein